MDSVIKRLMGQCAPQNFSTRTVPVGEGVNSLSAF